MKLSLLFSFLLLSAVANAQSGSPSRSSETLIFQPLSQPGQQRPLSPPSAPLLSQKTLYAILLAVLLILIFGAAILACLKISSILMRILIIVGALALAGLVSFALLFAIGITAEPDTSMRAAAQEALRQLGKRLGLSIETSGVAIEDDDFRVGLLLGESEFVVADYVDNRGLKAPYALIDTVLHYEGPAQTLPPLPAPDADVWVIETHAARQSDAAAPLYQIEWRLRNANPKVVAVRYAQPDHLFRETSSIARTCLIRAGQAE